MNYKTRQLVGFGGMFALTLLVLVSTALLLLSINRTVNIESAERYDKSQAADELRSTFYRLDGEIGRLIAGSDPTNSPRRLIEIEQYRSDSLRQLSNAERLSVSEQGQSRLASIRTEYEAYLEAAAEAVDSLAQNRREEAASIWTLRTEESRESLLDHLDAFVDAQQNALQRARDENQQNFRTILIILAIAAPLLLAAAILLARWTIRGTTRRLKKVTNVMRSAEFNHAESLPRLQAEAQDEIGNIALSFNEMAESLEMHNRMTRQLNQQLEEHTWIQSSLAQTLTAYQGSGSLEELGRIVLEKIVPLTGSAYGVFYVRQGKDDFVRLASYADYASEEAPNSFRTGEGLVGRAAQSGETLLIEQLPEHYLQVASGLGYTIPRSLLVAPVRFENRVEAVIELAALDAYSPLQRRLIEHLADTLGITLDSVSGRMEVERLLRESQGLAEELQTQTEELQSQSEELQNQTEELLTQRETMRLANDHLEQINVQMEEKNLLLEQAQRDLIRSSEFQSQFMANMSHELRTPLNSILILSQIMAEDAESSNEQEREYAATIYRSGRDLLALIDDILDLAKAESGKMDIVVEPYNIRELPQAMSNLFRELANKKGVRFEAVTDPDVPELIWSDGRRLEQIVKNLLSNAVKFTASGSVRLHISTESAVEGEESDALKIEVSDTGIGIPEEKRDTIFEAFRQADSTTERHYGGTGLGLSICREFAKLLGGHIGLESRIGEGSIFTLYLPTDMRREDEADIEPLFVEWPSSSEAAAQTPILSSQAESGPTTFEPAHDPKLFAGRSMLIVDDDTRNVYALSTALENRGARIAVAENGREALALLRQDPSFDLVLMDIMMPVMNGYEAMREIRSAEPFKTLPIIALTARALKDERELCLAAGASDYLSKPVDIEKLFTLIQVWLSD
ncbi:ATP-binding protein [Saccharibacillus sp. O23]|uniref:ATP-binding protein n=1 Tax=Saccharibacillus sp. O23 TaxID=2009338 RepID=UPI00117B9017|nr:ATP-binding protein [Saccharibacillus sp. O23]